MVPWIYDYLPVPVPVCMYLINHNGQKLYIGGNPCFPRSESRESRLDLLLEIKNSHKKEKSLVELNGTAVSLQEKIAIIQSRFSATGEAPRKVNILLFKDYNIPSSIKYLSLSYFNLASFDGFDYFNQLVALDLSNNSITSLHFHLLAQALENTQYASGTLFNSSFFVNLRYLDLRNNELASLDDAIKFLANFKNLTHLYLFNCCLSDESNNPYSYYQSVSRTIRSLRYVDGLLSPFHPVSLSDQFIHPFSVPFVTFPNFPSQ